MMALIGWIAVVYYVLATVIVYLDETGDAMTRLKQALLWPIRVLVHVRTDA